MECFCTCGTRVVGLEGRTVGEIFEVGGGVGLFVLRGGCESGDVLVSGCSCGGAVPDAGVYRDA
jgi:hypothetical protein